MTPEGKRTVKIIAIVGGIALILTAITILIVQQVQKARAEREEEEAAASSKPAPQHTSPTALSVATLEGRTFTKAEVEKMQSYMLIIGQFAQNEYIISNIRDTGGIDGKIGQGFKNALAECIRLKVVSGLDQLYTFAMKQ